MDEWLQAHSDPRQQHGSVSVAAVLHSNTAGPELLQEPGVSAVIRWQRPHPGCIKCNIDASLSTDLNHVGIGLCLRDEDGAYMLAKTMSISPLVAVNVGEALALFHALQWMCDMRFDNVDFVVDSKITADPILSNRVDVTEFGQIIVACQNTLSSSFTNSRVEFNRRQANVVAHALAREATDSTSPIVHFDLPDCIATLI